MSAAVYELHGQTAVITMNNPPVNGLGFDLRREIAEGLARAEADAKVRALVLIGSPRAFSGGADIREFGTPKSIAEPSLNTVVRLVENAAKPVVAAVSGACMGGGLELAMACHYRVAAKGAQIALPEVKLGLMPGAGGTQRLPRIVGPEKALEMVTSGQHVPAKACLEMGLVDEVVADGTLREGAIAFARKVLSEKRPLKRVRDINAKVEAARGKPEIFANFRKENARKFRGFLAPEYNIRCIEAAVNLPFDEGVAVEKKLFTELVTGSQSAAQRYVFFAERQVWKIPDVPDSTPTISVNKIGIVGAGTMGSGIAMNFANAGLPVTIVETSQEALDRGLSLIRRNYESTAKRGRVTADDVDKRMALIKGALVLEELADSDLVIEAVFENMDVKKAVFFELDRIVKRGAILATNTSALDIDEIAKATKRPEAVIGLHFFSPANVMRLLEVVRGEKTSKPVIATSMQLARKIGKIAALVGMCPGFVGNRMLVQRQREAEELVLQGATPWQVDKVLYDFGFPMGPFAMRDLAGLDIGWARESSKGETVRDVLCEMDRRGQKTGRGYYDYDANRNATPSPVTEKILEDFRVKHGIVARAIADEEILERCLYPMINEGAKILEEKMTIRASDIDIVCINGYGWPVYRGGPMFYGDLVGLDKVLAKMKAWQRKDGDAFKPAALLEKLVAEGKKFQDLT